MTSTFRFIYIDTQLINMGKTSNLTVCLQSDNMPYLQEIKVFFAYWFCDFDDQMRATVT